MKQTIKKVKGFLFWVFHPKKKNRNALTIQQELNKKGIKVYY